MRKLAGGVAGVLLAMLLVAPVNAAATSSATGTETQQGKTKAKTNKTAETNKTAKKQKGWKFDRSKAKQEVAKEREQRRQMIESGGSAN